MGFLSQYRVLDLTDERGLLAGKIFADYGADVIQVEPVGGSRARLIEPFIEHGPDAGSSLFWEAYACNKRGITCDFQSTKGKDFFLKLCTTADFLFESEAPGVMEELGLSYGDIKKINPNLIYISIKGFGSEGPKASYAESDLIIWAAGNALYHNRQGNRPPVRVSLPQSYMHASADAVSGALIAHFARLNTGKGQHVEISAQQSVAQCSLSRILATAVGDHFFEKDELVVHSQEGNNRIIDESGSGNKTERTKWKVKDGYIEFHLAMGTSAGKYTNNCMAWLYHEGVIDEKIANIDWIKVPDLLRSNKMNWEEIDKIYDIISPFFQKYTKMELMEESQKWKVLLSPLFSIEDLAKSEHLNVRNFWIDIKGSNGNTLRIPGRSARTTIDGFEFNRLAPRLGEHNYEVEMEVSRLTNKKIISNGENSNNPIVSLPLKDLKVVDLSWVVAGPAIGRSLADYGATVVRVESTKRIDAARKIGPFYGGKPGVVNSALYENVNAGKLGITLDLSIEKSREVFLDLVRWSDVIIESFSPGVMKRWGLNYESLKQVNPKLIMLSTSLMGGTGPLSNTSGFGNIGAALSGFMNIAGWTDKMPKGPFGPYTDYVGPRFSLVNLLAALDYRRRTGIGCHLDVSQVESGIHFIAQAMLDYFVNGKVTNRNGNRDPQMAPHGVYRCRDNEEGDPSFVAIAIRNDKEWENFFSILDNKEGKDFQFSTLSDRLQRADTLDEMVENWTINRTAEEVEILLQANNIPAHKVESSVDALTDPQLQYRNHFIELIHPIHGTAVIEGSRYQLSCTPAQYAHAAPTFGQDNEYVLKEILKYDEDHIRQLEEAAVFSEVGV